MASIDLLPSFWTSLNLLNGCCIVYSYGYWTEWLLNVLFWWLLKGYLMVIECTAARVATVTLEFKVHFLLLFISWFSQIICGNVMANELLKMESWKYFGSL